MDHQDDSSAVDGGRSHRDLVMGLTYGAKLTAAA